MGPRAPGGVGAIETAPFGDISAMSFPKSRPQNWLAAWADTAAEAVMPDDIRTALGVVLDRTERRIAEAMTELRAPAA